VLIESNSIFFPKESDSKYPLWELPFEAELDTLPDKLCPEDPVDNHFFELLELDAIEQLFGDEQNAIEQLFGDEHNAIEQLLGDEHNAIELFEAEESGRYACSNFSSIDSKLLK